MAFGFGFGLPSWQTLSGGFTPASLFSGGEQGAWYDPSDLTTLFQDAAGTTPVTAVEQPVGLMRDKSGRGNHASQSTATSRPVLRARYNLLTYSEQFDNAAWPKTNATVSANSVVAPDGTTTADTFLDVFGGTYAELKQLNVSVTSGGQYTYSLRAKKGTRRYIYMSLSTARFPAGSDAYFDLELGVVKSSGAGAVGASVTVDAQGFFVCSYRSTAVSTGNVDLFIYHVNDAGTSVFYTGSGTGSIYVWGADLRVANESSSLPAYQRVGAATDYDTVGFLPYLAFDGTDDSLSTAAIDFSATDKMSVFAGVTKLSDAARGTVVELTASAASNNGAFHLTAPNAASATFAFESKGTTLADAVEADNVPAAPVTVVATGLGNISGDSTILRINGVQEDLDNADQGTGNYANAAMYIGARGGSTLPFNGRVYSLLVLGRAVTATELTSTESYVELKTFGRDRSLVYSDEVLADNNEQITMDDGDPIYMTVTYV